MNLQNTNIRINIHAYNNSYVADAVRVNYKKAMPDWYPFKATDINADQPDTKPKTISKGMGVDDLRAIVTAFVTYNVSYF